MNFEFPHSQQQVACKCFQADVQILTDADSLYLKGSYSKSLVVPLTIVCMHLQRHACGMGRSPDNTCSSVLPPMDGQMLPSSPLHGGVLKMMSIQGP